MRSRVILICFAFLFASAPAPGAEKYPADHVLAGTPGPYLSWVLHVSKGGVPPTFVFKTKADTALSKLAGSDSTEAPVEIICLEKPNAPLAIGVAQRMRVGAPVETVQKVVDDIENYADIFPGYKQTKVLSKDGNLWLTFWEQIIPLFFVPNIKFEMIYLVNKTSPSRVTYRYQLKSPSTLKYSDGVILLEGAPNNTTLYTEFDFFDADWGVASSLGPKKIWTDAVEGLYLSDLAIRIKAENPTMPNPKIKETASTYLSLLETNDLLKHQVPVKAEMH